MLTLTFDRHIALSVGQNRRSTEWQSYNTTLSDFYGRFQTPVRGVETLDAYLKLKKAQQDELKDVGGYVPAIISGKRRKASAVKGRDMVTLDFDTIPAYGAPAVLQAIENMGCSYLVHSTRKHCETVPRLRVIIPLDRTVNVDEYEPIARRLAAMIGIQMADPTTFEPSRLMYWPSCCADGEYICRYADKPLASADGLLATYSDWRNWQEWPRVPSESGEDKYKRLAMKQGDPEEKPGIVGAFNRVYDVYRAMSELLPGIYEPCDNDPKRYTYLGGSTTGGAIVYDDGKFLFSHHATDPCSGKLVNAFDLVRLHKFSEKDIDADESTPVNRLPSFKAMCDLATADKAVTALMVQERREAAIADFQGIGTAIPPATEVPQSDSDWAAEMTFVKGEIENCIHNVVLILDNDPLLKGKIALNEFSTRREVLGPLPWNPGSKRRLWTDTDDAGLYEYFQMVYKINSRGNIDPGVELAAFSHKFNEVQDYLKRLVWDGSPRLDRLFIDYLGAEDTAYIRAVCRKAFAAAVARAMEPGCKFDNMLILCGKQGLGKSTILDKMSRGWFNDSIRTFEGKEASELLPGVWLVEIAELDAFKKSDVSRIKQFLSLRYDRYRAAYGRHTNEYPRRCVFFGTCNETSFLTDRTGNRRFWPVDVGVNSPAKSVWKDLTSDEIDQIWAEAKARWQLGEPLFLSGEIECQAQEQQELHRDVSYREGMIIDFVSQSIPVDWQKWTIDRRRDFWAGLAQTDIQLIERQKISAVEICCELFNNSLNSINPQDLREVNAILAKLPGWRKAKQSSYINKDYRTQRAFERW